MWSGRPSMKAVLHVCNGQYSLRKKQIIRGSYDVLEHGSDRDIEVDIGLEEL